MKGEDPFFPLMPGQTQHYLPMLMNSTRVRQVMVGLNGEQQTFVNELMGMLGREQEMRLQSEEQHQQVIECMEEN